MVILHLIDDLGIGGAQTLLTSYLEDLKDQTNIIVTFVPINIYDLKGVKHIELDLSPKKNFLALIFRLRAIIKAERVDIVHSHSYFSNILSRFLRPRLKIINHYHFADYESFRRKPGVKLRIFFDKLTINRHIVIVTVSRFLTIRLKEMFPNNKVVTIENFIECKSQMVKLNDHPGELKIICIGSCNKEKNYHLLIECFDLLKHLPIYADVYGGGTLLESLRRKSKLKQIENLRFLGVSTSIPHEIRKYNLFLSTSKSESFGLVILEAMCAGLPVVLSRIPAFMEIAPTGVSFFNSANELAHLLIHKLYYYEEADYEAYQERISHYSKDKFLVNLRMLYRG